MSKVSIPIPEWFVGEVYSKQGNCYVGSVGATSMASNAFCYRAWLERSDDGDHMKGECYDVVSAQDADAHLTCDFVGEGGYASLSDWLDNQYEKYMNEKRNEISVSF